MTKTLYERAKRTLWQWALPPIVRSVGEESLSYLDDAALKDLFDIVRIVERQNRKGILIEAGCALGGSAIVISMRGDRPGSVPTHSGNADRPNGRMVVACVPLLGDDDVFHGDELELSISWLEDERFWLSSVEQTIADERCVHVVHTHGPSSGPLTQPPERAYPAAWLYSARNASVGFTVEARYAGISAAPNAAAARSSVVSVIVTGSVACNAEQLRLDEPSEHADTRQRDRRARRDHHDRVAQH